ncbi:MAG: hypothetical protein LJE68_07940 [Rhodobacter sp.]|nr:hypothetical protein [Rhodobacter sp.]
MTDDAAKAAAAKARDGLQAELLKAHAAGDGALLVQLYTRAAALAVAAGEPDRAGFYRTHAWIFALECGHPDAPALRAALAAEGRVD